MVFTLPRCGCTSSITLFIGRSDPYPLQKAIAVWMLITYRPNSVMRCSFPGVQQIVGSLREIIVQISPRSYRKRTNEWTSNYNWQQMPLHQSQVIKFLQIKLSPRPPTKKMLNLPGWWNFCGPLFAEEFWISVEDSQERLFVWFLQII